MEDTRFQEANPQSAAESGGPDQPKGRRRPFSWPVPRRTIISVAISALVIVILILVLIDTRGGNASSHPPLAGTTAPAPSPVRPTPPVKPVDVRSFGPNGTHSPQKVVPFASVPDVTVAPSWPAVAVAIAAAQARPGNSDYVIGINAGTLTGLGIGSRDTSVLSNLTGPVGNLGASRARRILVKPTSGYGSVTVNGGMKVTDVNGVVFAGLIVNGGIHLGASNSAFWRIQTNSVKMLRGTNVELVDIYVVKTTVDNDDTSDLWAYSGNIDGLIMDGVWFGPSWGDGRGKHIDTLQFEPFKGFVVKNVVIRNSVFVGRVQTNGLSGPVLFSHDLLLSQASMVSRYPTPAGGVIYDPYAIMNGGPPKSQITLNDWIGVGNLTGAIGTPAAGSGIVSVSNARINGSSASINGFTPITTAAPALLPAAPDLAKLWK